MANNEKNIRSKADEIRSELDSLIGGDDSLEGIEVDPKLPSTRDQFEPFDFNTVKGNADKQAKKTITSLMKFYLDADIIEHDEYVKSKKKMDEMTMSSLIYQLQAGERALTTLLETIESGELAPRMFEVLATLQKSMLDIIKSQTMYLMAAEESTKRIARDIEIYRKKDDTREIEESGGNSSDDHVHRGTKELMAAIQAGIKNGKDEDIEDVEIEETKD